MSEHSRLFPPSGASRWMNCSASAEAVTRYADEPGEAAMEGTAVHWLVQQCLEQGIDAKLFLGRTISVQQGRVERKFVVTRDIATNVQMDVDFTREVLRTPGEAHVEALIDLSHFAPDFFGHCDFWHFGDDGVLTVKDTKNGRVDVPVLYPDGSLNKQMSLYALGVIEELSRKLHPSRMPTSVRLVIVQANSIAPGPRIKRHTVDIVKILTMEHTLRQAIHEIIHAPKFTAGHWCEHCPALGSCPPTRAEIVALAPVLLSVGDMTPADAGRILARKPLLKKIVEDAERVALESLLRGGDVPGRKLVTGVKHRQWSDEDAVYDAAGAIPGALEVVSPGKMEKLPGGKEIVAKYATIPPGGPVVAETSDKRPPYVARSADEVFGSST